MAFSLYAATVPSYRQILEAVSGLLVRAEGFCTEKGIAPQELIQARLAEDMLPFAYQVKSTAVHSLGAIEGVRKGVFSPPPLHLIAERPETAPICECDHKRQFYQQRTTGGAERASSHGWLLSSLIFLPGRWTRVEGLSGSENRRAQTAWLTGFLHLDRESRSDPP